MKRRWNAGTWGKAIRTLGALAAACVWVACAGISGGGVPDATTPEKRRTPVRIDRDKLAGLGLEEYPPMPEEIVLSGGAGRRGEVFFLGDELVVGVWEAAPSTIAITEPVDYDEFLIILSGKLILTDEHGIATEYSAGESVVVPKGFVGTRQMLGNFRDLYVMEREAYIRDGGE